MPKISVFVTTYVFYAMYSKFSRAVVPNLGPPDVPGLQLPEAFTTTTAGQDFWELKSKNIWRPKVGDHCSIEPGGQ